MTMSPPRILLVSNLDAPFVVNDAPILRELGEMEFLLYRGRRDFPKLVVSIARADVVVCWFVLGYAFSAVVLGRLLRIPTVLVAGGWDVATVPTIGYGAMLSPRRVLMSTVALRGATRILATSDSIRSDVVQWVARDVSVVPLGVD